MKLHPALAVALPLAAVPGAVIALAATARGALTWHTDVSDPLSAVAAAAGALAWAVAAWWTVAVGVTALARVPGRLGRAAAASARRITPAALRGLAAGLSGAALAGTTVTPAFAATPTPPPLPPAAAITLPVPGEPSAAAAPATTARPIRSLPPLGEPAAAAGPPPAAPRRSLPPSHVRVVRPGESLWSITSGELGPHADPRAVAERWPDWWAANRSTVGADPAHLLPGERLVEPAEGAA